MAKLRLVSDIHCEFMADRLHKIPRILDFRIPPLPEDDKTILIIAGDLGAIDRPKCIVAAIDHLASRFFRIVYVAGNHEYYGGDLQNTVVDINNLIKHNTNVVFDNFEKLPLSYLGIKSPSNLWMATLWSGFDKANPLSMNAAQFEMNDYRNIKGFTGNTMTADDVLSVHTAMMDALKAEMLPDDIIVTHHLPSYQSIDPAYTTSLLRGAYATDLDNFILERKPRLWMHGHTHTSHDYMLGDTRVVCNSLGYPGDENKDYIKDLVIEI